MSPTRQSCVSCRLSFVVYWSKVVQADHSPSFHKRVDVARIDAFDAIPNIPRDTDVLGTILFRGSGSALGISVQYRYVPAVDVLATIHPWPIDPSSTFWLQIPPTVDPNGPRHDGVLLSWPMSMSLDRGTWR